MNLRSPQSEMRDRVEVIPGWQDDEADYRVTLNGTKTYYKCNSDMAMLRFARFGKVEKKGQRGYGWKQMVHVQLLHESCYWLATHKAVEPNGHADFYLCSDDDVFIENQKKTGNNFLLYKHDQEAHEWVALSRVTEKEINRVPTPISKDIDYDMMAEYENLSLQQKIRLQQASKAAKWFYIRSTLAILDTHEIHGTDIAFFDRTGDVIPSGWFPRVGT